MPPNQYNNCIFALNRVTKRAATLEVQLKARGYSPS